MSDLTVVLNEETLKKAKSRAFSEGTSVDEVVRKFLESYAGAYAEQKAAFQDLKELSREVKAQRLGRRWSRDELYERK